MGYVGNQTTNSYSSMDKQVITGNGGASYTLAHAVANAQEIEVFVNNVRQEAGVAYTVSDNALTMTGNVASSDSFYVIYQGKALQTVVPPDDSVTTARINDGAVTTAKIADANITSPKMFSGFANGITELDIWYKTDNETISGSSSGTFSSNLARWATEWEKIGTGMTESSGVFTFPSTGKWQVHAEWSAYSSGNADYMGLFINTSTDSGSNYTTRTNAYANAKGNGAYFHLVHTAFFDVTNSSTFRLFFSYQTHTGALIRGNASSLRTHFSFMKIADT
tara:strand:- start:669 stop:1505 length:837 start_codon:yes stop_codon:yes gene_type:complete